MATLRWRLRQWAGILGWQGCAGIALAAAAAGLYFGGIGPVKAQISELQQEAFTVRAFSRTSVDTGRATAASYETWLEQFYRLLPARASAPDWLRVIFSAARAQSLGLEQGDYKVTADKNGRMLAYQIGLPVRGSYLQVRRFVADVLEAIPALALDELIIKREAIGEPRIEASLRFTLFLNAD